MTSWEAVSSFAGDVFAELLAGLLIIFLSYIYRSEIKSEFLNIVYWISNAEIHLTAKRVDYFQVPEEGEFDPEIGYELFEQIQEQYPDAVTNPDYSHGRIQIDVENIPTNINISVEKDLEFHDMEAELEGYKLLVETDSELRVGYRSIDALRRFQNFSEDTTTIISKNYFNSLPPKTSVVLCELKRGVPAGIDEISDNELNIVGRAQDSVLHMTFKNPRNLTEGVRKHFRPA
jgi:hypothetical protein